MDGNKVVSYTTIKSKEPVEPLAAFNERQAIKQGYGNYQPSAICTSETDMAPLVKVSTEKPFFIVAEKYYVCKGNGQVLFLRSDEDNDSAADGSLPNVLRKPSGNAGSGVNSIHTSFVEDPKNPNGRKMGDNLTQTDFDGILKGKPSIENLLAVYDCWSNSDIDIDIATAIPLW